LEKYAVRCGGGWNHRTGLFEAVLIKDNHLALWKAMGGGGRKEEGGRRKDENRPVSPHPSSFILHPSSFSSAVLAARRYLADLPPTPDRPTVVEVEVDSLQQLDEVLPAGPDLVLLDNMDADTLRQAVARRDRSNAAVELEASGGIDLKTVLGVAETGVERISVGAMTHSAAALDIGLDWLCSS
jgi:nicotinate-nucleotide pyrophosphorylase (carboxylating)